MNRNLIAPLLLICILYFSCSKSNQPGPQNTANSIKIELVSGNNQTDTIGRPLPNFIVVKVTKNGVPQTGYNLQYEGSGCNEDKLDEFPTGADGTGSYNWFLAGDVGQQTMKIFVLDSQHKKLDSVTAVSAGLSPGHGWHFSACTPFAFSPQAFCKLSSGRLFVSFVSGKSYLRYSDDNGGSWNAAKSLGKHEFQYVMSTPADELFAVAMDGNYYSKDGGQTWTSLGMQVFNTKMVTGIVYTATGKLLVSTRFDPLFISLDMGKTWTAVPSSAITFPNSTSANSEFYDPLEDKDGNLYIEAQDSQTIYKSADVGKTWSIISGSNELDVAFYIDNNNWLYKCINQGNSGEIAISKDKGVSYTQLIIPQYIFVNNMSVQSDGNFYFSVSGSGVFKANGISSSVKKIYDNEASQFTPYIVAKNNNIVAGNAQGWISYYTQ